MFLLVLARPAIPDHRTIVTAHSRTISLVAPLTYLYLHLFQQTLVMILLLLFPFACAAPAARYILNATQSRRVHYTSETVVASARRI